MPVDIDGFAVLAAIGRNPGAFAAVKAEAGKAAKAMVGKQLKDKALGVADLRALRAAIGPDNFDLIADGLADAEIKALLTRLDKHTPALKAGAAEQRRSMAALAGGAAEPVARSEAAKAAPPPSKALKPKVERSANSRAMRAKKQV